MSNDRQVHARTSDGAEIVRYDRAGKWYRELPDGARCLLTLSEAVEQASAPGVARFLGCPGGKSFDARLRRALAVSS